MLFLVNAIFKRGISLLLLTLGFKSIKPYPTFIRRKSFSLIIIKLIPNVKLKN